MSEKYVIYAVDDEESIRELYRYALESAGFEVSTFDGGDALFARISARLPDLILLDIMLDGSDGYELLDDIRKNPETRETPVIMVSAKGAEIDKVKGLDLGADDYISKPFGVLELIARIKANLRRRTYQQNELLTYKGIVIDDVRHEIRVNGSRIQATAKEYDLVRMLVKNHSAVLSRDRLLDEIWGENYGETRTLDMHITQARRIIRDSGAEIKTIRGIGYMLE